MLMALPHEVCRAVRIRWSPADPCGAPQSWERPQRSPTPTRGVDKSARQWSWSQVSRPLFWWKQRLVITFKLMQLTTYAAHAACAQDAQRTSEVPHNPGNGPSKPNP